MTAIIGAGALLVLGAAWLVVHAHKSSVAQWHDDTAHHVYDDVEPGWREL